MQTSINLDQLGQKTALARAAVERIETGMVLGLGTGSTIDIFITEMSKKCASLSNIKIVATSLKSAVKAKQVGLNIVEPSRLTVPDLCIDGADEVSSSLTMIKGGEGRSFGKKLLRNLPATEFTLQMKQNWSDN